MNASTRRHVAASPAQTRGRRTAAPGWPKVTLHLPLRDEQPELVRRTLDSLAALDYPDVEVLVVDTHTADPLLWEPVAEHCARLGPQFRFFHLGPFPGFRAGALNFALRETSADTAVIGVLKAGQVVRASWLRRLVPLFRQPGLGLAQSPLDYRADEPSRFNQIAEAEHATHRSDFRGLLPLSALPLFRAEALRLAGGWDETSMCPEMALGLALLRHGWDAVSPPEPMGRTLARDEFPQWQARRQRQVAGGMAVLRKQARGLLLPRDRSLTAPQRHGLLHGALPALADLLAITGLTLSLGSSAVAVIAPEDTAFPLALMPMLLLFALLPALRVAGHGWLALAGSAALSWRSGRAAWQGLLGGHVSRNGGTRMEKLLLLGIALASLGVALANPWGGERTLWWLGLLAVQALPGVAALAVASTARRGTADHYAAPAFHRTMA
ncbi:glycosyltransferase [Roseomonas aerophila]|uniref:Glycosyltransferase n=1 Tax=Teichococcus aerophilus TaxID=1224513 RepID=A0ABR7RJ95_9PROT|nr:glycosyltransferase [Pseudoroseomonas aerophila]MBC9206654.1 glycosyltransferase [Pseudoroseomonas aerophila]